MDRPNQYFSPLFIGELPSTRWPAAPAVYHESFQSPLHRGTPFNTAGGSYNFSVNGISVPSSSGNSLQPFLESSAKLWFKRFQSPLHRGTPFNSTCLPRAPPARRFQSPLHRGTPFNAARQETRLQCLRISVPSSSGNSLQLCGRKTFWNTEQISVPSSSGNSLQRAF